MLTIKTNTYLTVSLTALLTLSPLSFADNHAGEATTDGAFTTLMVAAPDTGKYIASLKKNSGAFKAVGAAAAGVCVTQSGHEYPGQMMIWSGYPSIQAALIGSSKYDPSNAPSTQGLPDIFGLNSGLSIISKDNMIKYRNIVGSNPSFYKLNDYEAVDVDRPIDFEFAEFLYLKYRL